MPHPILTHKLRIPSLRLDFVPRPQLIAQLDKIWQADKRLILVCAPAGYGKTSLIASWVSHLQQETETSLVCPDITWVSLDEQDNDLPQFLLYLIEALKKALTPQQYQDFRSACELMETSQSVSAKDILTVLLNTLSESSGPFILVLDDYHTITNPAINESVQFLLANLPPNLRFLLATRMDPPFRLAQLRARNQMVEIRTAGLQFTLLETTDFINRTFGLSLKGEQIVLLANRTEGWAAGLQMAALSLQGRNNPEAFIQAFGGSHRLILEYLMEEVLNRQPPEVQEFLLRTSIFERLCPESCDFLLDQPITNRVTLKSLERMNLFLVPLDDEGRWYRYHHLFASLLRSRLHQSLDAATIHELYRRASQWYESQGLLTEAIAQALAAPDLTYAADLLEREILRFFYQSEFTLVHSWLESLPKALLLQRSLLCAVYAASISLLPPYAPQSLIDAEHWMAAAERALSDELRGRGLARAFILKMRSYWARWRGERPETVLQLIASALSALPVDSSTDLDRNQLYIRSALQTNLAMTYWAAGDEEAARKAFIEGRRISTACDDLFNESQSIVYLVKIYVLHGKLGEAVSLCREALTSFDSQQAQLGRRVPFSAEIGVQLAEILIEQNQLAGAEQLLQENIELARWTLGKNILLRGHLALARLAAVRSDPVAAFEYLNRVETISDEGAWLAGAQRANLWLALSGKHPDYVDLARQWAHNLALVEFSQAPPQMEWTTSLALARLILMEDSLQVGKEKRPTSKLIELLEWLERQERAMQGRGWDHWEIQLSLIECLTRQSMGDQMGALADLRHALELGASGGYIHFFVDEGEPLRRLLSELGNDAGWLSPYLGKLLAAFADTSGQPVHLPGSREGLIEPLTVREIDVLLLICQGFSNQAIAEKLVVTLSTVKKHNYSIFGKLGVSTRAQAIVRAKQLGLSS